MSVLPNLLDWDMFAQPGDQLHYAVQEARDIDDLEAAHQAYLQQSQRAVLGATAVDGLLSAALRVAHTGCVLAQHGGLLNGLGEADLWATLESQMSCNV